jgi:hypothetical protein
MQLVGPPEVTETWPPLLVAVRHHPDTASAAAIIPIFALLWRGRFLLRFRLPFPFTLITSF